MFNSMQSRPTDRWGVWSLSLLAMLFVSQMTYAAVVSGPDLSVTSVSGAPGNNVSVSIIGDFNKATNSVQLSLQFDPNLLTVSSVTAGSANSSWVVVKNSNTAGTAVVGMFNTGGLASALSGPQQQIVVINFTVNNPPGSSATSSALILSNVNFDAVKVTQLNSGTFTLNVPPVDYTLTVNLSGSGTVSENPDSATYKSGSQVVLTAVPASGNQFSGWGGAASGSANPLTLTMNANTSVTANFMGAPTDISIITQPASVTVTAPATATFTVAASGTPAPSYQWAKSTDGGSTFTNISGANGASYTTAATTVVNSGTQYECVVTNASGTATSNAATLTVDPASVAPSITMQPVSVTVTAPDMATFTLAADGTPAPRYQWMESVDGGDYTNISGANSASYIISSTSVANSGSHFECVVTNAAGSVTSDAVRLTVNPTPVVPSPGALTLEITSPADGVVTNDRTPTMIYTTNGTVTLMQLTNTKTGDVKEVKPVIASGKKLPLLADGEYLLKLISQDTLGHQTSSTVSFTLDTVPPTLKINAPLQGALVSTATPVISYTTNGTITQMSLDKKLIVPILASGKHLPSMVNGKHTLKLVSSDDAGNETVTQVSFSIEDAK